MHTKLTNTYIHKYTYIQGYTLEMHTKLTNTYIHKYTKTKVKPQSMHTKLTNIEKYMNQFVFVTSQTVV